MNIARKQFFIFPFVVCTIVAYQIQHSLRVARQEPAKKSTKAPINVQQLFKIASDQFKQRRYTRALQAYNTILTLTNNKKILASTHLSIGQVYEQQNYTHKAIEHYQKTIDYDPNMPQAHVALAGSYWMIGDYERGFKEYEWRWQLSNKPELAKHIWKGSDVNGKTVVLLGENGLGDVIQFLRFAKEVKELGAHTVCLVPPALVPLCSHCEYIDEAIAQGSKTRRYDAITSIQSLPVVLNTTVDTLPSKPYLYADPKLV